MSTSDSTRHCKKFGKGRGTGKHHTRRNRIADHNKASIAQANRAAHRPTTAQSHVKTAAQIGGNPPEIDREFVIVGTATPPSTMKEQLRGRVVRPNAVSARPIPFGGNSTTIIDDLRRRVVNSSTLVTDADCDKAITEIVKNLDDELAEPVITTVDLIQELDTLAERVHELRGLPIEELDLTVRAYNILKRVGVNNLGELADKTETELLDIRNFGQKSIDEVKAKLAALEPPLSLKGDTQASA